MVLYKFRNLWYALCFIHTYYIYGIDVYFFYSYLIIQKHTLCIPPILTLNILHSTPHFTALSCNFVYHDLIRRWILTYSCNTSKNNLFNSKSALHSFTIMIFHNTFYDTNIFFSLLFLPSFICRYVCRKYTAADSFTYLHTYYSGTNLCYIHSTHTHTYSLLFSLNWHRWIITKAIKFN